LSGGAESSIAALGLILAWRRFLLKLPPASSLDSILTAADQADLELAARAHRQKDPGSEPGRSLHHGLVIDFFRGSSGTTSPPGSLLADRFSESKLAGSSGSQEWQGGRGARPHKNHVSAVLAS
jgi:hypothetical protein